ncbi:MAG: hypothetical protein ACJAY8_001490 [Sphingobacteriales bacterium]
MDLLSILIMDNEDSEQTILKAQKGL